MASSPVQLEVLVEGLDGADQGGAAAGDDAFLDGSAGGVEGVLDEGLTLLHLGFGGGADVDLGDAAGELGESLLELLAVVLAVGLGDLAADHLGAALDLVGDAGAVDDGGGLAGDE